MNATLRSPDRVLAELNSRFLMDNHDGHYFTMWFGVYRLSTATLKYANAGHPPALLLSSRAGRCEALAGASMPVGMFADSEFTTETLVVDGGAQILLYRDGMLGDPPEMADFATLCAELAAGPAGWLDELIERRNVCDDDCSLVLLRFSGSLAPQPG
jgi:sigma-B regulation protein RsbU (phosphoserine phosphatase)